MEQEKGGREGSGVGHNVVEEDHLNNRVIVWDEDDEIVFGGTSLEEVNSWIESHCIRNFTVPILWFAGVQPSSSLV